MSSGTKGTEGEYPTLVRNHWRDKAAKRSSDNKQRREETFGIRSQVLGASIIGTSSISLDKVLGAQHAIEVARIIANSDCW